MINNSVEEQYIRHASHYDNNSCQDSNPQSIINITSQLLLTSWTQLFKSSLA